jgi:hypothetical protein
MLILRSRHQLTLDRGFVLIHASLAVTADFIRVAANAGADNPGTAAFAVVTSGSCAAATLPVAADNSVGATHSAAVGIVFATANAVRAGPAAAFPVAVDIAGRTADAVDADFSGVAAVGSANSMIGAAMGHCRRRLSSKSRAPESERRQDRASNGTPDHAQHLAP